MSFDYVFTIAKERQVSNWNNTATQRRKKHLIALIHTISPKTQLLTKVSQKKTVYLLYAGHFKEKIKRDKTDVRG